MIGFSDIIYKIMLNLFFFIKMYCIEKKLNLEKFFDLYCILKEVYCFIFNILGIFVYVV